MMSKNTMNAKVFLPRCLLLLWTLTAFVSGQGTKAKPEPEIKVSAVADGIKVFCPTDHSLYKDDNQLPSEKIDYRDDNTGEYVCKRDENDGGKKIYVKFRTCDNCVDLDTASVSGMIVGDIVATVVIGVAVYLVASQATRTGSVTSNKKSSDRQQLIPGETSNRSGGEHYQALRHKKGQRETYDVINNKR